MRAFPALPPPLPGAGQFDIEFMVTSTDEAEVMEQYSWQLIGAAFGSGKFLYADSDLKVDLPQTRIVIDRLLGGRRPAGFAYEPRSHFAVAAAVAQKRADWGVTTLPVARQAGVKP